MKAAAGAAKGSEGQAADDAVRHGIGPARFFVFGALILAAIAVLIALGVWQLERRLWKLDLIARVEQRVHAAPVAAPGPPSWPGIDAADDAYLRVRVSGQFTGEEITLVQAVTTLGGGYWVLAPFRTDDGFTVLVNRGFLSKEQAQVFTRDHATPEAATSLTGLLRISEPGGAFLRRNDPAAGRWYSRDVAAIGAARGIRDMAPYFIDADASANRHGAPVGGLTVVTFPNNHLVYALTWFGLAAMLAGWSAYVGHLEWRSYKASRRRMRANPP